MLKKLAPLFLVFALAFATVASAQTLTFSRAYQDYQYNLTLYENSYSDYQDAKNAYLSNQTLALKETARQKTLTMLENRDKLLIVYLTVLRTKISELADLSTDDKNAIFGKIDPEVVFYNTHQSQYSNNDDLQTLFSKSAAAQNEYTGKTSLIVQEAMFDISLGQVEGLRLDHEKIYSSLKSIIDTGVAAGILKLDPFNRWIADIDGADTTLKTNETTAKSQIAQIYNQSYSFGGGYDSAIETLTSSLASLSKYNEFLTEVLSYIKTHE